MPEPARTDESIFAAAADLPPADRAALLDRACADPAQRARVDDLLASHDAAGSFLRRPLLQPTADFAPPAETAGTVVGRYKLLQPIGEGGFGVVYMAEQREPVRRKVALKVIKLGMDSKEVVARFEAERQALALMDHPNIAKVLDAGTTESGRPYFVMELVKGVPLGEFCDQNHLATRDRLALFAAACSAVQHAHQKGVIHRDLKPSNILVTLHDGRPVPKVIDFGVAKALNQELTEKTLFTAYGHMVGTPQYMSPEQAEMSGLDVDTRSDVYSLGVLLYELLTGTTPLEGKRLRTAGYAEMQRLIKEEEAPRPSTRVSTLGERLSVVARDRGCEPGRLAQLLRGELDWIVLKCLEKDRTRRYDTASALARDVERYLADEPVEARPSTLGYRLRKAYRKNRGPVIAASLAVGLLVAGIVGTTLGLVAANRARAAAAAEEQKAVAERDDKEKALAAETEARRAETATRNDLAAALAAERRTAYDMTIPEVQRAYRDNDLNRARALLESCPEYLRGFEWHLLNREFDRGAVTIRPAFLRGSAGGQSDTGLTGDGRSVVAATLNAGGLVVQVWDAATGAATAGFHIPNPPGPGGRWRATVSPDFTRVALWQPSPANGPVTLHNGEERQGPNGRFTRAVPDGVVSLAKADGKAGPPARRHPAPAADQLPAVFVYDLLSGRAIGQLAGHPDWVSGVAFGPDNGRIATGCEDKAVRVWDASAGKVEKTLRGHDARWSEPVGFTPDGKALVSVGAREHFLEGAGKPGRRNIGKRELRVWDLAAGTARVAGEVSGVWSWDRESHARFSPDGRYAVGIDPLRPVIDLTTGKEAVRLPPNSIAAGFADGGRDVVVFTHPGLVARVRLATGQTTGTYRLPWKDLDGDYALPTLNWDGTALACVSPNMSVCVTDPMTGFELRTVPTGVRWTSGDVHRLTVDPAGTRVLVENTRSHELKAWDLTARSPARTLAPLHNGLNWVVAVSPDARAATCVSQGRSGGPAGDKYNQIDVVDLASGRRVERGLPLRFRSVTDLGYSPDGRQVGGLFYSNFTSKVNQLDRSTHYTAVVLDTVAGTETVGKTYRVAYEASREGRADRSPPRLACAPDGTFLFAYAEPGPKGDEGAETWNVEEVGTGRVRLRIPAAGGRSFVFAPNGRAAALLGRKPGQPAVEVWDLDAGAKRPWPADPLTAANQGVAGRFSGDGRRLLLLSEAVPDAGPELFTRGPRQPRATVWDVPSGTPVCTFAPPMGSTIDWALFSPDGERLLFYSGLARNNFTSLWNATTGRELLSKLGDEISVQGGAFTRDGRLILEVQGELGRAARGSRLDVWDGTPSGPVWQPAPTADGLLEEAGRLLAAGRAAEAVERTQRVRDAYPAGQAALSAHGRALIRAGRPREAIDPLRRAVGKDDPDEPSARRVRTAEYFLLALAYQQAGQPDEARGWFDAGDAILHEFPVYPKRPPSASFTVATTPKEERARSEPFRAEAAAALGLTPLPLPPLDAYDRSHWAIELAKKGDHALATRTIDQLLTATRISGILYNAACVHSVASGATADAALRSQYADRALALLREAVAANLKGHFASYEVNVVDHMSKDSDLDAIRDRPDFKQILAGLNGPPAPKGEPGPPPRKGK